MIWAIIGLLLTLAAIVYLVWWIFISAGVVNAMAIIAGVWLMLVIFVANLTRGT